jgi:poly(3-hydroxybutyrate) depolymerase
MTGTPLDPHTTPSSRLASHTITGLLRVAPFRAAAMVLLGALALMLATTAFASTASDFLPGTIPKANTENFDLPYQYLVPPGYSPTERYPLIVFLHGSGEEGSDNLKQLANNGNGSLQLVSDQNQQRYPAFMLAPQANFVDRWNANTLAQTLRAIRRLESQYSIDHDRIYVTGLSRGGYGTYLFTSMYPDVFAAAVPLSGWLAGQPSNFAGTPVWAFHAADDSTVSVTLGDNAVVSLRQAGGRVIYTRYTTGGHEIWPTAYANPYLLPWMMAQRRHQPSLTVSPIISITDPAAKIPPLQITPALNLSGTAVFPTGDFRVYWTFGPLSAANVIDPTLDTAVAGTTSWSINNAQPTAAVSYLMVLARGPSWAEGTGRLTGGGATTVNDTLWVIPPGTNLTPPSVAISSPSPADSWTTPANAMDLSGSTTAQPGQPIQTVTWVNDRGGEGAGVLNPRDGSWTITDIALQDGFNLLTVTAKDAKSVSGTATLLVNAGSNPSITAQPQNAFVLAGNAAHFSVKVSGKAPLSYQWQKNAVAISGATSATLTLDHAQVADAGTYSVVITGTTGQVTSSSATLTVSSTDKVGRLMNLSVRAVAGSADQTLIIGFVVAGAGDLPVLIRGVGPALKPAPFNLTDALSDPLVRLFRASTQVGENNDWGGDTTIATNAARLGAFPLAANSKDAALSTSFVPGAYSVHVVSASGAPGIAVGELFDATPVATEASPRLSNISGRAQVDHGNNVLIGGFVVGGGGPVTVLIRALGPMLTQFNVSGVLADPVLELHSSNALLVMNDNWSDASNADDARAWNESLNSPLPTGSKDAVIVATLPPGAYSAVIHGLNDTTGVALLEIYELR